MRVLRSSSNNGVLTRIVLPVGTPSIMFHERKSRNCPTDTRSRKYIKYFPSLIRAELKYSIIDSDVRIARCGGYSCEK